MTGRAEQGATTRAHIVGSATALFVRAGYDDTSVEDVLRACALSRGALYHHFGGGKTALFAAVLEAQEARVAALVRQAAAGATDPLMALRAGCAAWLDLARDPAVRQIVLLDAPSALGWAAWREVDARHGLGLLRAGLDAMAAAGRLDAASVEVSAHMLLAVLIEMALLIARAGDDATRVTTAARAAVEQVLSGLARVAPNAPWEGLA